jgi:hypothetical protein
MFIYNLDNENGGQILSDSDTTAPALQVNSNAAGQSAIAVLSTASGRPLDVSSFGIAPRFLGVATIARAVNFGRTVNGTASIAPVLFQGASAASGAVLGFTGAISLTSIILTSVANFDYVIPIEINGEARYIPAIKAAGLVGAAVFT